MIHRLSQFLVFLTLLLLFAGGLVTSTESGLAVPDWPLSFGTLFPPMVGGVRFEHTHRILASSVGLLTLILTLWIGATEKRREIRWLSIACLGAVVLQGVLGGLTVLFRLPAPISVAHACLGPIFFCLAVSLAAFTKPDRKGAVPPPLHFPSENEAKNFHRLALAVTSFFFLQLLLGAVIRHTGQGVWLHIVVAFLVLILTGVLVSLSLSSRANGIQRPALFLGFLVVLQFFLGIGAFGFTQIQGIPQGLGQILFPTFHQTLGAMILAASVVLTLRSTPAGTPAGTPARIASYLEVTKPRLVLLILWSMTVGFLLASPQPTPYFLLFQTLVGTALLAAGAMALNELIERESDALMKRTENRPLPSERLTPREVLVFGVLISILGLLHLAARVNLLTASLGGLTLASYLFLYTPLKTRTWTCTLAGAVPGALPPVIGWAAARGALSLEAWILFAIVFVWQLPHFLAIAWMCREDYARAGLQVLSVVDPSGERVRRQMIFYSLALLILSLLPPLAGMTGYLYYLGAFLLGVWFLILSFRTAFALDDRSRAFFRSSVIYLSVLFLLMIFDKI